MRRWLKRIALGLVVVIVLAISAILIVLHTGWGHGLVRGKLESALVASFPGGAHVGAFEGSVFGGFVLHDLELDGPDHKPMIVVGTAHIDLALLPLARKVARIDHLVLEDVVVHIPEQSASTPPKTEEATSSPPTWSLELADIAIHRARVTRGTIELTELELAGSVNLPAGEAITALVAVHGRWRTHLISATATVRYRNGELTAPLAAFALDRARLSAIGLRVTGGKTLAGSIAGLLPLEIVREFADVELPSDVAFGLAAPGDGSVDLHVYAGDRRGHAIVDANLAARSVRGIVIAEDSVRGTAIATVEASFERIHGIVSGVFDDVRAAVAVDASPTMGVLAIGGRTDRGRGGLYAEVKRSGATWQLVKSRLVARASDVGDVRGSFGTNLRATGRAWPDPDLRLDGVIDGVSIAYGDMAATGASIELIDVRHVPARPVGRGRLDVVGLRRSGKPLGSGSIDARATVERDGPITIDLDSHQLVTADAGTWAGTGGKLVIGPTEIALRGLRSTSGAAGLAIDASLTRPTGDLAAKLDVHDVALAMLSPGAAGTVGGKVSLARRGGQWSGGATLQGRGIAIAQRTIDGTAPPSGGAAGRAQVLAVDGTVPPSGGAAGRAQVLAVDGTAPPSGGAAGRAQVLAVDGDAEVRVAGRRVTLHGSASAAFGSATLELDVEGPRDLADVAAWRRLDRSALRELTVAIARLDTSAIGGTGAVDGELGLAANDAHGTLHLRGMHSDAGELDADLTLAPVPNKNVDVTAIGHLAGLVTGHATARLELPVHPFDPTAWRALGRGVLRSANAHTDDFAFDPGVLAKLGVTAPYYGHATATVDVSAGAATTTAAIALRGVAGGTLAKAIDLDARLTLGDRGLDASLSAGTAGKTLVALVAHSPVTVEYARTALHAPVIGTMTVPSVQATDVLAIFGRTGITSGTLDGTIALAGTIGTPTAHAKLTAHDLTVPAGVAGHKATTLSELAVDAKWGGVAGELELTGRELSGGTLHVTASGRPAALSTFVAALDAKRFDLAPLAAFAPGPLVDGSGTLDASIEIRGLDPASGTARGELHLHDGRVPLSASVGTLHRTNADFTVDNHTITAKVVGRLGAGDFKLDGTLAFAGATPARADVTLALRKISPIAVIEPVISADLTAHLKYGARVWTGDIDITNGSVAIPSTERDALLDAGTPSDMTFVDAPPPVVKLMHRPPPSQPWLVANVALQSTNIDAENLHDVVSLRLVVGGHFTLSAGDSSLGLDGKIDNERGDVEILNRPYQVDHASLVFDGSLDPLLDVRLVHDFEEVTLMADIQGRASAPDLELSSDPGIYTKDQLLGFFLGGEPGGDPASASRDAATGAGASVLSSKVGARLKRVLPLKLDVLTYEAGTSTTSGAVRAGRWLMRGKLFLQYLGHPEARPDENANEADVEYYLPHNWLLNGNAGDRGIAGADLLHRWRW